MTRREHSTAVALAVNCVFGVAALSVLVVAVAAQKPESASLNTKADITPNYTTTTNDPLYNNSPDIGTAGSPSIPIPQKAPQKATTTHRKAKGHKTTTSTVPVVNGEYEWCGNPGVTDPCSDTSPKAGIRIKLPTGHTATVMNCVFVNAGQTCFTYVWEDGRLFHTVQTSTGNRTENFDPNGES